MDMDMDQPKQEVGGLRSMSRPRVRSRSRPQVKLPLVKLQGFCSNGELNSAKNLLRRGNKDARRGEADKSYSYTEAKSHLFSGNVPLEKLTDVEMRRMFYVLLAGLKLLEQSIMASLSMENRPVEQS
ncbi:hypothetical protein CUMW_097620 [Citrus unshiu]|uniref:Uncharacterized protein n=1 Tax=Citrus unshiu TaxID=55188 RepID=A0A2H5P2L5_CITUN|nr:hypothetical protein CUMW_097620 [Citrus unshiu]